MLYNGASCFGLLTRCSFSHINAFDFMALHLKVVASVYMPNLSVITAFDLKASSLQPESRSFHQYLNKLESETF